MRLYRTNVPGLGVDERDDLLAYVPAGRYTDLGDRDVQNASPPYDAEVAAFWIEVFPVSAAAFARVVRSGEYTRAWRALGLDVTMQARTPDQVMRGLSANVRPGQPFAVGVDYFEALAYAQAVGRRLPTETEWEIAMLGAYVGSKDAFAAVIGATQRGSQFAAALSHERLSGVGCWHAFRSLAEWTSDRATPSYFKYFPLRQTYEEAPLPSSETGMSVRGFVSISRPPSAKLRQSVRAATNEGAPFPIGMRCAVTASEVIFSA